MCWRCIKPFARPTLSPSPSPSLSYLLSLCPLVSESVLASLMLSLVTRASCTSPGPVRVGPASTGRAALSPLGCFITVSHGISGTHRHRPDRGGPIRQGP